MSVLKLGPISLVVASVPILLGNLDQRASSPYASMSDDPPDAVCWDCVDRMLIKQWHRVLWPPAPGTAYGYGDGVHKKLRPGTCLVVHGFCIVGSTGGEQSVNVQELTREVSDAVASSDFAKLAEYANIPSVKLVADRSAIQILGCDGETIAAHIPVAQELLTAVERATTAMFDPDA